MNPSLWLCVCGLTLTSLMVGINSSTVVAEDTPRSTSPQISSNRTSTILQGTKPGCSSRCGNVIVPYPFGIIGQRTDCALNNSYEIECYYSQEGPKAYLGRLHVLNISNNQVRISDRLMATNCDYRMKGAWTNWIKLDSPFTFSELNMMTAIGCDDIGLIDGSEGRNFSSGCLSICTKAEDIRAGECSGSGCCQSPLPKGSMHYVDSRSSLKNNSKALPFNKCSFAFLAEQGTYTFQGVHDFTDPDFTTLCIVLDWFVGNNLACEEAGRRENKNEYVCKDNTKCVNSTSDFGGYGCECKDGYQGNPYLGCYDIDECKPPNKHECVEEAKCKNTRGNYTCSCPKGYTGDGRKTTSMGKGCNPKQFPVLQLSLGLCFGFLSTVVGITWLYFSMKERKLVKMKEKFFRQNGGLVMIQQLSSNKGGVQSRKIFTSRQLKKATKNYADKMVIGRGGYGIVYKGILPDKQIVAIKKSKIADKTQIEQFINELIILTQINHENVVKLLGCCLEEEVPLLVYEYVSNGTLLQHIHDDVMTWENRLRIATEAAGSLAYLHSAAAIIHRDVKSANILLNEHYIAKIADFGASRLVPIDQGKMTTLVLGTKGYLDPEYFRTSQLTDKSDVYSFGVVLAELLTGQKTICFERRPDLINLATYFVESMKENRLFRILEPRVINGGALEQLQACGELVYRCLQSKGADRPTMKEVEMELKNLRKFTMKHTWDTIIKKVPTS